MTPRFIHTYRRSMRTMPLLVCTIPHRPRQDHHPRFGAPSTAVSRLRSSASASSLRRKSAMVACASSRRARNPRTSASRASCVASRGTASAMTGYTRCSSAGSMSHPLVAASRIAATFPARIARRRVVLSLRTARAASVRVYGIALAPALRTVALRSGDASQARITRYLGRAQPCIAPGRGGEWRCVATGASNLWLKSGHHVHFLSQQSSIVPLSGVLTALSTLGAGRVLRYWSPTHPASGAKHPASPGRGPHTASQNPLFRHDRSLGPQSTGAGRPASTFPNPAKPHVFLVECSSVRTRGTPPLREWDTPLAVGKNRESIT